MPRKKAKSGNRAPNKTSFLEKSQIGISLTSQAFENLNKIVAQTGLSKSKVVENLVTGSLAIASQVAEQTISIESDGGEEASPNKIEVVEGAVAQENSLDVAKPITQEAAQSESAALAEFKEKIKEHKANLQALKERSDEQETLIDKLQKQLEGAKQSASSKTEADNNTERQLQQEIERLKQQQTQQQKDNKTVQKNSEAHVQELEQKLAVKQKELDKAQGDRQNAEENSQQQIAKKELVISELQQQLSEKQSELDKAQGDRQNAEENSQQQIVEKESAISRLQQQLSEAEKNNRSLQTQNNDAQNQVEALRAEIQQKQGEIDHLDHLRGENQDIQRQITDKQGQIATLEQQVSQQKIQIEEQNQNNQNIQQKLAEQEKQIEGLKQQISAQEQSLNHSQQQLNQEKAAKEEQAVNSKQELEQAVAKSSQLASEGIALSALIKELNQQLETEKKNCNLLDLKGNEQNSLVDSLRSQLTEQTSLLAKKGASGTYKTWTIILLGVLLTVTSLLSAKSYLF